jgi:hypothetical protein
VKWTLIYLAPFVSRWRSERLSDDELQALEAEIMRDPSGAPVMRGTGGLRKIRFAPPSRGKGKSGSMRVGYAVFPRAGAIFVIAMFLKKDDANWSRGDQSRIKAWIEQIGRDLMGDKA